MTPRLLTVFGPRPDPGNASGRVFYRHLDRFIADGWSITITDDGHAKNAPKLPGCDILALPSRRLLWPPVRQRFFASVRLRHLIPAASISRSLRQAPPSAILTGGIHPHLDLARILARKFRIPLHVLLHDWWPDIKTDSVSRHLSSCILPPLLSGATAVWAVSDSLANQARRLGARAAHILPPMPDGFVSDSNPLPPGRVQLGAFGSYGPGFAPMYRLVAERLRHIGGTLTVVTNHHGLARRELANEPNIEILPYFPDVPTAIDHVTTHCTALLVAHPFATSDAEWTRTSFPSKLVEFVHTRLPVLILARPEFALGTWATSRNWRPYADRLEPDALDSALAALDSPEARGCSAAAAAGEFCPARIHASLRDGILASLPSPPHAPDKMSSPRSPEPAPNPRRR